MSFIEKLFQITKPRIIDVCDLAGYTRYKGRLATLIWTCASMPSLITTHGIVYAGCWFIKRHPHEVSLILTWLSVINVLHSHISDDTWLCNSFISNIYNTVHELLYIFYKTHIVHNSVKRNLVVGIIPDGNRRWGKLNGIGQAGGHFYGSSRIMDCIKSGIIDTRIKHLIIYILTYDNLQKRSETEQCILTEILNKWTTELRYMRDIGLIQLRVCGEPPNAIDSMIHDIPLNVPFEEHSSMSSNFEPLQVSLLIGYDGRREIANAKGDNTKLWITDEIDGVIRTGGFNRSSCFCNYQTGYSEWLFVDKMWPEITPRIFYNYINKIQESTTLQNYGK